MFGGGWRVGWRRIFEHFFLVFGSRESEERNRGGFGRGFGGNEGELEGIKMSRG